MLSKQRKFGLGLAAVASLLLVLALLWWRNTEPHADARAQDDVETSDTTSPSFSSRKRPVGARLNPTTAAKAAVSGTIHDPEGRPIADAQVCAISSTMDRLGVDDRKPHCVRSGPDGRYRIESLLPIRTALLASAVSFKPSQWHRRERSGIQTLVTLRAGQTITDLDIELAPGGVLIHGVVKDIAGGEIEGAQVTLSGSRSGERGSAIGYSGPEGRFELWGPPGSISVTADAGGYALARVEGVAPGQFMELFLTPESVLVGKVVLASSGEPVEGAVVSAGYRGGEARTDEQGRFRIDRLEPGTYKPNAETDELYGQTAEQVHLGLGETSEPVVIRVHPAVYVEGTVIVAGADRPCTHGTVRLDNDGVSSEWARIDEEGHVEFRGVLAGEYRVNVDCPGHISEDEYDKLIVATESLAAVWQVREGLSIRGEVVDDDGQPAANISVRARPVIDPEAARTQVTNTGRLSDADGSFELFGLLPGRYELSAGGSSGRPATLEPVVVELGNADVDGVRIVMPAVGGLRGRVIDQHGKPVSGAALEAKLLSGLSQGSARSNDAGEFTLENLRPGPTRVTASSGEGWWSGTSLRKPGTTDDDVQGEVVEVLANEVVELTLIVESRTGRISGVVKDEGGGLVADAFIDFERISDKTGSNNAWARRGVRWGWGSKPFLTDADGRFELRDLPEGKFLVRAHRKGGGEAVLEDVALGSHIELTIASTGELSGTVMLAGGGTPERFSISIEDKVAGISRYDSFFRTDGVWRVREVPAGSFEIVASANQGTVTLEAPIELREGEIRRGVDLLLQPRLTLRGRIVDLETREPIAGLEVRVSGQGSLRSNDAERRNVTGSDGRFEIDNAPTGRVYLVASSRAGGSKAKYDSLWKQVTLVGEPLVQDLGDVEMIARRLETNQKPGDLGYELNAWDPSIELEDWEPVVASVRPGGPADQSGLAGGDVIEAIGGYDVRGTNSSRYFGLTRVPEGTVVKLELRGGKTVEITAGPAIQ